MLRRKTMKLSALFEEAGIPGENKDVEISFITDDSRKCRPGSLFVCHSGGEKYLGEALKNGAQCVVSQNELPGCVRVADSREAYSTLCRAFFGFPEKKLRLIGVTGTNGKTTTASMLAFILELSGRKTGLISTVANRIDGGEETDMTTPDCFLLSKMLSSLVENSGEFCVIEASSQGLFQKRLSGLRFETAIFTNLTEDHLDYHKTFENYKNSKKELFRHCENAVLNFDDPAFEEFSAVCGGKKLSYSVQSDNADFTAKDIREGEDSLGYVLVSDSMIQRVKLNLCGDFNVQNSLAAIIGAYSLGIGLQESSAALKNYFPEKGRMEILDTDTPYRVIIDYAHTPDSLRRALLSLRRFCRGRLIVLFGCGGEREREKRPQMGKIASENADIVFVTADNSRSESTADIIDEILSGVQKGKASVFVCEDRRQAIAFALKKAKKGDTLLLAGKGHETFQQLGSEKKSFDEREIVRLALSKR